MESQIPLNEFASGTSVVYGLHGKCKVLGIETRQVGGQSLSFYKLEVSKSALSRSTRQEPAIWIPVNSARSKGLRVPMDRTQAEEALSILSNREYYFSAKEPWTSIAPQLEDCIQKEGGRGLAKVTSYLHVLKKKQIVPSTELTRLDEAVTKALLRELAEALGESIRNLETRIAKGLRQKLIPDN